MFIPLLSKSAFLCTQATTQTFIQGLLRCMCMLGIQFQTRPVWLAGWAVLCCLRCLHCVVFIGLPVVPGKRWLSCVWHFNFLKQTLSREFVDSSFSAVLANDNDDVMVVEYISERLNLNPQPKSVTTTSLWYTEPSNSIRHCRGRSERSLKVK